MKKTEIQANIISKAQGAAAVAESWADLSNFLFNPDDGLITKAYPTRKERESFQKTTAYKLIRKLLGDAMRGDNLVEGATPRKSGKFVVRVPRTLHEALEIEAINEGTSLNQLVVFKLAAQVKPGVIKIKNAREASLNL